MRACRPTLTDANLAFTEAVRERAGIPSMGAGAGNAPLGYAPRSASSATPAVNAIDRATKPAAAPTSYASWGGLIGERASKSGDGNAAGLDQQIAGVFGGVELFRGDATAFGSFTAGLALGYTRSNADSDTGMSSAEFDSGHFGVYTALERGPLLVTAAASYGFHDVETDRQIVIPGVERTAEAEYHADSIGFSSEARYRFALGGLTLAPLASLEAAHVSTGGGSESGAGSLNLSIEEESYSAGAAGLGIAAVDERLVAGTAWVRTEIRVAYEHGFGDQPEQRLAFVGGTTGFAVAGLEANDERLALGAAVEVDFANGLTLSGRYEGSFGSESESHRGQIALGYKF